MANKRAGFALPLAGKDLTLIELEQESLAGGAHIWHDVCYHN